MNPLVSIIVPTRNRVNMLRQALRSACAQSWPEAEIVVVDEASTDDTAIQIEQQFPKVKLIRHAIAKGPSAARNTGFSASSGEHVLFLDDDDLLHPDHVRSLVEASRPVAANCAVSGRWRRFELVGNSARLGPVMCCPENRADDEILAEILESCGKGSICQHSVLWPRSLFERIRWDEALFTNGDFDFYGRAVLAGCHIFGTQAGMAYYRTHAAERVAGSFSYRGLVSSTRFRLKWTELLSAHPHRERFSRAMQNALMLLLIEWSQRQDAAEWLPKVEAAYRAWSGGKYYLPVPPRNPLKRFAAKTALKLGGPAAVGALLKFRRALFSPTSSHPTEVKLADAEDAQVVASFG